MAAADELGFIAQTAASIGASESGLRIILSLLAGYPLAVLYRIFLFGKDANIQHLCFTISGFYLCYFNFGSSAVHSLINIVIIYVLLVQCGGTSFSVGAAFVINMAYLTYGYYSTMTDDYTISWSTPHCVLTLRLTGLVFDVFDGAQKQENLTEERKQTALKEYPTLMQMCGNVYFFGGFLVGPQFSMRRYLDFVDGTFSEEPGVPPASVIPALKRLAAGAFYTLIFQLSDIFLPDSYLISDNFEELSWVNKCLVICIWGKLMLAKYVGCWLITEGACILTGLPYNGRDEKGNRLWNACANILIIDYEKATSGAEMVASFNVNTNLWMGKYVFKRLRWLGNKQLSQAITLFFLAFWHGLHSGYFNTFFLEFIIMSFDKGCRLLIGASRPAKFIRDLPYVGPIIQWIIAKIYTLFFLGYALVSFSLFSFSRYMKVYKSFYYFPHILFMAIFVIMRLIEPRTKQDKKE